MTYWPWMPAALPYLPPKTNGWCQPSRRLSLSKAGDWDSPIIKLIHTSPFGVIPKKGQQNKWRLIVDLSSPKGASVNDGINTAYTSICYSSIDDVVKIIQSLGRGALMAKLDLKAAYRFVPVHPVDHPLLGTRWKDVINVDTALPFGLSSAPKIFSAVADAFLWIMFAKGVVWALHYLDDFIIFGSPDTQECQQALKLGLQTCAELGREAHKIEGPSQLPHIFGNRVGLCCFTTPPPRS